MSQFPQARPLRVIVSGGGTGGHIFPAIAIADELARLRPGTEFLFVGASGKMEMDKVPRAGYRIEGLPIRGLQRKLTLANLSFPFRLLKSLWKSRQLIRDFQPDVVVGTGGYAGGPVLYAAARAGVPTLVQEPNAYAGLANKWLGRHVDRICVAFAGMERFFPAEKLVITGNPVRQSLLDGAVDWRSSKLGEAASATRNILLMGGSGGARSLNEAMAAATAVIADHPDVSWTWQCGQAYYEQFKDCATAALPNVELTAFLDRMDEAYGRADLVIGRAGSTTIAEIEYLGKPAIFVPSPWVAEDHQTMNARALTTDGAAYLVPDVEASARLVPTALDLLNDSTALAELGRKARARAKVGAVTRIAREVLDVAGASERHAYFIGIGGIGMSALARYYHRRGWRVSGYDRTATDLTKTLEAEGIGVHYQARPDAIPGLRDETDEVLYVYTPAVSADFAELQALRAAGKPLLKRAEALGRISRYLDCVAVAGTHGKTTTTTLATYLLRAGGVDTSAFLGGIPRDFAGNYVHGESNWVTVEADEYDRSFLQLDPRLAVILGTDADHLDIYGDHKTLLREGFGAFAARVDPAGCLLLRHDLTDGPWENVRASRKTFGIGKGDYRAERVRVEDGRFVFDFHYPGGESLLGLQLPLPGRHNVENATAALALALEAGADADAMALALPKFRGIGRRFEFVHRSAELTIIDDYAHHPTELRAAIGAARELFPDREICGVFQPHLYSRTRDFAADFASALDLLDRTVLLPIYPAREEPIAGVSSEMLLNSMQSENKRLLTKEELPEYLHQNRPEVLLLLGAGDIAALVADLTETLTKSHAS